MYYYYLSNKNNENLSSSSSWLWLWTSTFHCSYCFPEKEENQKIVVVHSSSQQQRRGQQHQQLQVTRRQHHQKHQQLYQCRRRHCRFLGTTRLLVPYYYCFLFALVVSLLLSLSISLLQTPPFLAPGVESFSTSSSSSNHRLFIAAVTATKPLQLLHYHSSSSFWYPNTRSVLEGRGLEHTSIGGGVAAITTTRRERRRIGTRRSFVATRQKEEDQQGLWLRLRGGAEEQANTPTTEKVTSSSSSLTSIMSSSIASFPIIRSVGNLYGKGIRDAPIFTKSMTAAIVFGISEILAQSIENRNNKRNSINREKQPLNNKATTTGSTSSRNMSWLRVWSSFLVGFIYFGPASHYWYEWIFTILPKTNLSSTLQKAALGQLLFGPTFMCIFFASSLLQNNTFSIHNWITKIRQDLFITWLAGVGFWPLVDLIGYSYISKDFMPLFVNICSLIWTVYLSLIANR